MKRAWRRGKLLKLIWRMGLARELIEGGGGRELKTVTTTTLLHPE